MACPFFMLRVDQEEGPGAVYGVLFAVIINNRFEMFDPGRYDWVQAGGPGFDPVQ